MKNFFKQKQKLLLVAMIMVVSLTGCAVPRDSKTGKTYADSIITVKDETVKKQDVVFSPNSEEEAKYKDYKPEDEIIIPKTTFKESLDEGWFNGFIVYPIAQLINLIASVTDAGVGIIATTLIIQILIFLLSLKSQVASQKMQAIQPEVNKIQAKYAGRSDQNAKMQQAQELQALYSKHKINPFGTMLIMFIQLPVLFGMYNATLRAYSVVTGSFMGLNLVTTPMEGMKTSFWYIVMFVLMLLFQFLSFKMPQWLQAHRKKKSNVKEKKYAQPTQTNGLANSMNMMVYMNMIIVAFLSINWPSAMTFYWLVSSVVRVIQNVVVHKFFMKD